ncbi:MAG: methyl-accepting chemotaxis protein [Magnetococcales bacterium]|nr:methyl-accepting chemotaxis protein [Magnetococcales bacterium]
MIRLQDIRLHTKLTGLLLLTGLIPVLILWWLRDHQADETRLQQATVRLESARQVALGEIKRHITERRADMEILAQIASENHRQAKLSLEALRDLKKERVETFLTNQINDLVLLAANPDFVKRIAAIDWLFRQAGRKSDDKHWRETVEGFVPWLHGRQAGLGVEDLYFISPLGDVVYTLNHRQELGQNLQSKPLKDSPLATAHRQAMETNVIQDFLPYAPADNAPSAFFGTPVKKEGTVIGSLIVRISRPVLSQLLHAGVDPTQQGELYLIAGDGLRTEPTASHGSETPPGAAIKTALEGKNGSGMIFPPGQAPRLAAWAPIGIKGLRWAIVVEKDASRIFAPPPGEKRNWLHKFSETAGYYDLFLVHPDGNVFFTAARQADLATNLISGKYAGTNLGQLIQKVLKTRQAGLSDLVPYPPSDNQPAFFMAHPVLDHDQVVLVAALQLAPDAITALLHPVSQATPYRIFLVGPDEKLRSDAFTDAANPATATAFIGGPATAVVSPKGIQSALAGETGTQVTQRSDGKRVLSSYAPLPLDGFLWGVIAEIDMEELSPTVPPWPMIAGLLGGVALLTLLGSLLIRNDLVKPLQATAQILNRMASGHFPRSEPSRRQDELGGLNRSLTTLSSEVTQAGQRIQQAAEPMSVRIRRLASFAMVISRESSAGADTLAEARAAIAESSRLYAEETRRLANEQSRLISEQTHLMQNAQRLTGLTAEAIAESRQVIDDSTAAWRQMQEQIRRLQESTLEMVQLAQTNGKPIEDGGKTGKHPGKHAHVKEGMTVATQLARTAQEMQDALEASTRLISERQQATEHATASLDAMLPAIPMLTPPEVQPLMVLEHTPNRAIASLEKLDVLLKKNVATSREIILAAKGVFDITTGSLKQATSYFVPDSALPEPLASQEMVSNTLLNEPEAPHTRLAMDPPHAVSPPREGSDTSPSS